MLTDSDREILKPDLGTHYSSSVLKILQEQGVTNPSGKPFSNGFISMVFNGTRDNIDVELAIYELRDRIIEKRKKLKKIREKIKAT